RPVPPARGDAHPRGARGGARLPLAGEHPRAQERALARRDPRRRGSDRPRTSGPRRRGRRRRRRGTRRRRRAAHPRGRRARRHRARALGHRWQQGARGPAPRDRALDAQREGQAVRRRV
ncbi:MAG: hypothetical protein AVDCRST_MAG40-1438, partial [uncultured Gemmatimonadaceae bacterium]